MKFFAHPSSGWKALRQLALQLQNQTLFLISQAAVLIFLGLASLTSLANNIRYGTGFILDSRGYIATAGHVVRGSREVNVYLPGKANPDQAEVVKINSVSDIALLKISSRSDLPPLPIGRYTTIPVGLNVFALGHPRPSIQGRSLKITTGLITGDGGLHGVSNQFQFSAPITIGNSGGPVLGPDGSVIGLAVGRLLSSAGDVPREQTKETGVGFALKSEMLLRFLSDTPVNPVVESIKPFAKGNAQGIFKQSSQSVVLVEAILPTSTLSSESRSSGDVVGPKSPNSSTNSASTLRQLTQTLIGQGFREPARTSVGYLLIRTTGTEIKSPKSGLGVEAELVTSLDSAKQDRNQREYRSSLSRIGYDCMSQEMAIFSRDLYAEAFLSGLAIDRQLPARIEWVTVPSTALRSYLSNSLCK